MDRSLGHGTSESAVGGVAPMRPANTVSVEPAIPKRSVSSRGYLLNISVQVSTATWSQSPVNLSRVSGAAPKTLRRSRAPWWLETLQKLIAEDCTLSVTEVGRGRCGQT